jgi:hypothetical protein
VACGVIRPRRIVAEDYLRTGITGESSVGEKFSDVLDVLVAAAQLILTTGVVDANEEGFLADHGWTEIGKYLQLNEIQVV